MKAGDLVRLNTSTSTSSRLGKGLIMSIDGRYCWVWFEGWRENSKWCELRELELISECR